MPLRDQLFDHVLHDRLARDGQHFLRLRFGGGQQPGTDPGHGYNGALDHLHDYS